MALTIQDLNSLRSIFHPIIFRSANWKAWLPHFFSPAARTCLHCHHQKSHPRPRWSHRWPQISQPAEQRITTTSNSQNESVLQMCLWRQWLLTSKAVVSGKKRHPNSLLLFGRVHNPYWILFGIPKKPLETWAILKSIPFSYRSSKLHRLKVDKSPQAQSSPSRLPSRLPSPSWPRCAVQVTEFLPGSLP